MKPRLGDTASESFQAFILDVVGGDRIQKGSDLFITCKGEKLWASTTGGGDESISLKCFALPFSWCIWGIILYLLKLRTDLSKVLKQL